MNIIIYTVLILAGLYFLLRYLTGVASKKISKGLRILLFIILKISFLKYIITAINDPVCVAILNKRF